MWSNEAGQQKYSAIEANCTACKKRFIAIFPFPQCEPERLIAVAKGKYSCGCMPVDLVDCSPCVKKVKEQGETPEKEWGFSIWDYHRGRHCSICVPS